MADIAQDLLQGVAGRPAASDLSPAQAKFLRAISSPDANIPESVRADLAAKNLQLDERTDYVRAKITGSGTIEMVAVGTTRRVGQTTLTEGKIGTEGTYGAIKSLFVRFAREATSVTDPGAASYINTGINADMNVVVNGELEISVGGSVAWRGPVARLLPASSNNVGLIGDETYAYELPIPARFAGKISFQAKFTCSEGGTALGTTQSYFAEVGINSIVLVPRK